MISKTKSRIKIAHLNIQSISDKLVLLNEFIVNNEIDIICLNETFLTKNISIQIDNYSILRKDRLGRGGGVAIVIHNSLKYKIVDFDANCEYIAVKFESNSILNNFLLVSYYNPPNIKLNSYFLNAIFKANQKVLLLGDLNAHHQLWNGKRNDAAGKIIYNNIIDNDLVLLNDDSMTYQPPSGRTESIIDFAISSTQVAEQVSNFIVSDELHSDHLTLIVTLKYNGPHIGAFPANSKEVCLVKSLNFEKLDDELIKRANTYSSPVLDSNQNIDKMSEEITQLIQQSIDSASSHKVLNVPKNKLLTLPREILVLIKQKRKLRRKIQKNTQPELRTIFNRLNSQIKAEILRFKQYKWQNFCSALNSLHVSDSKLWKGIKSIDSDCKSTKSIPKLLYDGELTNDPLLVSELFACNLEKIFTNNENVKYDPLFKLRVDNVARSSLNESSHNLESKTLVSVKELISIIDKIRGKGAPGPDSITNKVIKRLPFLLLKALVDLFNASIALSHIPSPWKNANVSMIHKYGKDSTNVNSYRPISLLNTLSKLLERVIKRRLDEWLAENNILSNYQSGFRSNHSTKDHLLRLTQECQQAFNRNMAVGALFIDIEKAFDRVWINGLLFKLLELRVPCYLGCWLKNYLMNRSFQVKIQGAVSSQRPIQASVPQGSILGPVLFLIFFNDVTERFTNLNNVSLAMFADDFAAWIASEYIYTIERNLQLACNAIYAWSLQWRTCISTLKTVVTIFNKSGKSNQIKIYLGEEQIKYEKFPKFLGITYDQGLTFAKHNDIMCIRARRRLLMLASMKGKNWGLSQGLLLCTYKVLIRTIFDYSSFIILSMSKSNLNKLSTVQNSAIRKATYWPPSSSTSSMLALTGLTNLYTRSIALTVNQLNKSLTHNQLISCFFDDYLKAYEVNEGAIIKKNRIIRRTILGKIIDLPPILLNSSKLNH